MSDQNQTIEEADVNQITPVLNYPAKKRGSMVSWRGNKYPEVKLRGFYSDITSQQNVETTQVTNKNNLQIRLF
jgi:hypothetical protein